MKRMSLTTALVTLALVVGFAFGTQLGRNKCNANSCIEAKETAHSIGSSLDQIEPLTLANGRVYTDRFNSRQHGEHPECPKLLGQLSFGPRNGEVRSGVIAYDIQCNALFKEQSLLADNRDVVPSQEINSFNSRLDRMDTRGAMLYR